MVKNMSQVVNSSSRNQVVFDLLFLAKH